MARWSPLKVEHNIISFANLNKGTARGKVQ